MDGSIGSPPASGARDYQAFLEAKAVTVQPSGFDVSLDALHPAMKPHQKIATQWALKLGKAALFKSFGLGKGIDQQEFCHQVGARFGGAQLIVAPFGVHPEFEKDAELHLKRDAPRFIQSTPEILRPGIYLTNYESVRDGKIDAGAFNAVALDEADVLRGMGGSKTFREFMNGWSGVPYKLCATATPDPNEYVELLAYAAFLDVMDIGQAKTRFFQRDSEDADNLTLYPHKEREFWLWVASWALFIDRPSDIGCPDEGYDLPELKVHWVELPVDHLRHAGVEKSGQGRMFAEAAHGVTEAAAEKRRTLEPRVAKALEIVRSQPDENFILWHDLEAEREAIERALPEAVSIYGKQSIDERAQVIRRFGDGWLQYLAAKPSLAGAGCNFQHHCARAVFVGIGFKFRDLIQAIHRIQRFLQKRTVEVFLVYAESERSIRRIVEDKWARHEAQRAKIRAIVKEYGLNQVQAAREMTRSIGVERVEAAGEGYTVVNNDCVVECGLWPENSVDLMVTSVPFSTQYEYSPSYNDFGHNDDNAAFFAQMDYLTPRLLRMLKPGRVLCVHVKDRIVPGSLSGLGFQTVYPFHAHCILHYMAHGFGFLGQVDVVTDVVRENNQTYRLGWSEKCKDGSTKGFGVSEYVLVFRKPPTDRSRSYADEPVVHEKPMCRRADGKIVGFDPELPPVPGTGFSRARWQVDAHGYWRSGGDRLLRFDEMAGMASDAVYQTFKAHTRLEVYDYEAHVRLGEILAEAGRLPPDFMLLAPASWTPAVWDDVMRALTLNTLQAQTGREKHVCPLQFDIVDRLIELYSNPGELVFDPFGGIGSVPYRALKKKRRGAAVELNPAYFAEAVRYCEAMAREVSMPGLFDLMEASAAREGEVNERAS